MEDKTLKGKIQKQTDGVKASDGIKSLDGVKASAFYNELNILRAFRDNILSNTLTGARLIRFYYQHSREVAGIINSDQAMKSKATGALTELSKILEAATDQDSVLDIVRYSIPLWLETDINALLDEIARRGSDGLRADIEEGRRLIQGE